MKNRKSKAGRKRISESRATEIRTRLTEWKQIPEPIRISLRALAAEIGTSHQLLSFYLSRWDNWQRNEYRRKANDIRSRAETETRPQIVAEMLNQAQAFESMAFRLMLSSALNGALRQLKWKARDGQLARGEMKMLRLLASRGYRDAQEILDRYGSTEKSKNNLPLIPSRVAKSFRHAQWVAGNSAKTVARAVPEKTGLYPQNREV
jgi:hypothetical protein